MKQMPEHVSPMGNEARNTYVVGQLTCALLRLLKDVPLDAISISTLCQSAGVARASFYRNFSTREDILRADIRRRITQALQGYLQREAVSAQPVSALIGALFSHFETQRDYYALLNERGLVHLLKDVVMALCGPRADDAQGDAYAKAFVAYSLYGMIEVWFARGMRESAEELSALLLHQAR